MTLLELRPRRVALDDLVDALPDPPAKPARSEAPQPRRRHPLDDALLALPAEHYARMLAGLEASRAGKITCPFHRGDTTPSLQLYDDGSWYCFGCQRGGTIYDFAAALWHTGTKNREFIALRDRLAHVLGISTPRRP